MIINQLGILSNRGKEGYFKIKAKVNKHFNRFVKQNSEFISLYLKNINIWLYLQENYMVLLNQWGKKAQKPVIGIFTTVLRQEQCM